MFGFSVSISNDGNTVAASARQNDGSAYSAGHVRVYLWKVTGWEQKGNDIDGEATRDYSGGSISLSADGNSIAIGADGNVGTIGGTPGHARVYIWNGSAWQQKGNDIDGQYYYSKSGAVIALSGDGDILAVSDGHYNADPSNNIGRVKLYKWGNNSWKQLGQSLIGENNQDNSGASLSLSSDGTYVAIGAIDNDGNGPESGHVRVFHLDIGTTHTPNLITDNNIIISPNPSSGIFTITNQYPNIESITITNLVGQTVERYKELSSKNISIQINGPEGIYFAQIRTKNGHHFTKKLIKQ